MTSHSGVGEVHLPGLFGHGVGNPLIAVPDITDDRTRRSIDVLIAVFIPHINTFGVGNHRQRHDIVLCVKDILGAAAQGRDISERLDVRRAHDSEGAQKVPTGFG